MAAPLPAHHQDTNTPGPSAVGAEPAWMDQLVDKLDSRIQTAVNEALNARQAAVSSPTMPAAPQLDDVEQAVQASMLASVSESMTGTGPSCSFIPSSIPILNQVGLTDGAPSLQLVSQKRSAPLTLADWIKAWNRFCAIFCQSRMHW